MGARRLASAFRLKHTLMHRSVLGQNQSSVGGSRIVSVEASVENPLAIRQQNNGGPSSLPSPPSMSLPSSPSMSIFTRARHFLTHRPSEYRRLYYKPLQRRLVICMFVPFFLFCIAVLLRLATWGADATCGNSQVEGGGATGGVVARCIQPTFAIFRTSEHESCICSTMLYSEEDVEEDADGNVPVVDCNTPERVAARSKLQAMATGGQFLWTTVIVYRCYEEGGVRGVRSVCVCVCVCVCYFAARDCTNGIPLCTLFTLPPHPSRSLFPADLPSIHPLPPLPPIFFLPLQVQRIIRRD